MFLVYFLLWVIFNGSFTLEICVFGLVIAGVLLGFSCRFMDYSLAKERKIYCNIFGFCGYCVLLVKEIVKANFGAMHLILTQREEIEPVLVTFHSDLKTQVGKVLLANAITLTPGTITVTLEGSEYRVHCLDRDLAKGLNDSEFIRYIRKFEEEKQVGEDRKQTKGK